MILNGGLSQLFTKGLASQTVIPEETLNAVKKVREFINSGGKLENLGKGSQSYYGIDKLDEVTKTAFATTESFETLERQVNSAGKSIGGFSVKFGKLGTNLKSIGTGLLNGLLNVGMWMAATVVI